MKVATFLALANAFAVCNAWNLVYYSKKNCKGQVLAFENVTKDLACHKPIHGASSAGSVRISGFKDDNYNYYYDDDDFYDDYGDYGWGYSRSRDYADDDRELRFYDTDDCMSTCSHRHVIAEKDWSDCVSWPAATKQDRKMQSFSIVEVGDVGMGRDYAPLSDGVCQLKHGTTLFYRNRWWKMQQIAAGWFREIPEEDFDPEIHVQETASRFAQHGDIDSFGKYKLWQRYSDEYFDKVPLEQWDEDKHTKYERDPPRQHWYEYIKEDLCEEATRDEVDRDLLLEKIPTIDEICKGWVNGRYKGEPLEQQLPIISPSRHHHVRHRSVEPVQDDE